MDVLGEYSQIMDVLGEYLQMVFPCVIKQCHLWHSSIATVMANILILIIFWFLFLGFLLLIDRTVKVWTGNEMERSDSGSDSNPCPRGRSSLGYCLRHSAPRHFVPSVVPQNYELIALCNLSNKLLWEAGSNVLSLHHRSRTCASMIYPLLYHCYCQAGHIITAVKEAIVNYVVVFSSQQCFLYRFKVGLGSSSRLSSPLLLIHYVL